MKCKPWQRFICYLTLHQWEHVEDSRTLWRCTHCGKTVDQTQWQIWGL